MATSGGGRPLRAQAAHAIPLNGTGRVKGGLHACARTDSRRGREVREDGAEEVLEHVLRCRVEVEVPGQTVCRRDVGLGRGRVVPARKVASGVRKAGDICLVRVSHGTYVYFVYREIE